MAGSMTGKSVPAPGAMTSPQAPGMVPDWTTVPTHVGEAPPPAATRVRPLTQYATAEELAGVFRRKPEEQLEPVDFEQAPASFEELRKDHPANLPPLRPGPPLGQAVPIEAGDEPQPLPENV
jgi:hypothetical protein